VPYVLFPETKDKTLGQMDELFGDHLIPHALKDPTAAEITTGKTNAMDHHEVGHV
jgi:hypothetical protein